MLLREDALKTQTHSRCQGPEDCRPTCLTATPSAWERRGITTDTRAHADGVAVKQLLRKALRPTAREHIAANANTVPAHAHSSR